MQFTFDEVKDSLQSIDGVIEVHNLRLWSLTVGILSANVHLRIGKLPCGVTDGLINTLCVVEGIV